ncbi:GM10107 [Drosophila sechellia]|uniref:GM10107 n=1 Tax=Drosophila sechellia TaxID=7238 RepID=B4IC83_DROSE|nr:GM10107 [Drosophila sechellia]
MARRHYWNPQHNWLPGERTARTHFGQDIKTDEQAEDVQMDLLWTSSRATR